MVVRAVCFQNLNLWFSTGNFKEIHMKTLLLFLSCILLIGCTEPLAPADQIPNTRLALNKSMVDWTFIRPSDFLHPSSSIPVEVGMIQGMLRLQVLLLDWNQTHSFAELTSDHWISKIRPDIEYGDIRIWLADGGEIRFKSSDSTSISFYSTCRNAGAGTDNPGYDFRSELTIDNSWQTNGKYARCVLSRVYGSYRDCIEPLSPGIYLFNPDTATQVAPLNNATNVVSPVFSWTKGAGAKKYWLCASTDDWKTLVINDSTLTDTVYVVGKGLLANKPRIVWNVATGNDFGWNTDSWKSQWAFSSIEQTQTGPVYLIKMPIRQPMSSQIVVN
jgi:uncharacterized protein YegJ (DUF2314 family)